VNENDWIFDKRVWTFVLSVAASILVAIWLDNESFTAATCGVICGGIFWLASIAWGLFCEGIRQDKP
jgi:drug/metabolite transporter superfamily protein YnfA